MSEIATADIAFAYATGPGDGHRVRSQALADELRSRGCVVRLPGSKRQAGDPEAVVLDYADWADQVTRSKKFTVAITDLDGEPYGFLADLVINPNVSGLGGEFCILRAMFDKRPARRVRKRVTKVLVCKGGPGPIRDMRAAMLAADVGIVTAGTLLHEACAMGLPTISVSLNRLQEIEAQAIARQGATHYAGPDHTVTDDTLMWMARNVLASPALRMGMSVRGVELIDRRGRARVADMILDGLANRW